MKIKIITTIIILALLSSGLISGQKPSSSIGVKVMAGGRYDDLRMCVGSDAGVKGGPIADIMFLYKNQLKYGTDLAVEIPVMRPILFGAAFEMLQFEPQISLEISKKLSNNSSLIYGPGLGVSFHYGPDYKSSLDDRGDSFFAIGPLVSGLVGLRTKKQRMYGIRLFYTPLFSGESSLSPGTVLGLAFESHFKL